MSTSIIKIAGRQGPQGPTAPANTAANTPGTLVLRDANGETNLGSLLVDSKITHAGDTNTHLQFPSNDTITLTTSGTERFRVASDGKIGIAQTSPIAPLSFANSTGEKISLWSDADGFYGFGIGSLQTQIFTYENENTGVVGNITFGTGKRVAGVFTFTECARLTGTGRLGFGTTTPADTIHVNTGGILFGSNPGGGTPAPVSFAATVGNKISLWSTSTNSTAGTVTASNDTITSTGHPFLDNEAIVFTAVTGAEPLVVDTTYWVRDVSANSYKVSATYGGAAVDITTDGTVTAARRPNYGFGIQGGGNFGSGSLLIYTYSSGQSITFGYGTAADNTSSFTELMRLTGSGRLGIGTTSPSTALHVVGDLTLGTTTTATSANAGTNSAVPAQVVGYLVVSINGTSRKIPYFAT